MCVNFVEVFHISIRIKDNFKHKITTVIIMAKKGMRRPNPTEPHGTESNKKQKFPKNDAPPVPQIKAKKN